MLKEFVRWISETIRHDIDWVVRYGGEEFEIVLAADISADHSLVALGGPPRLVRVYSTASGERVHEIKKHTDWIFLRHEDISRDPVLHFRDLYAKLNLEFLPRVEAVIHEYTDPCNPSDVPVEQAFSLKRDSRAAIWSWKSRLTESETTRVREGTLDVAREFYSDDDW